MSLPILSARNPEQAHRAATPLELLFDLVSVIAIASATAELHHAISSGHGLDVLPRFAFLFFAIWWTWINFTWFASAFDSDGPLYRLLVMVVMGGQLLFAGGVEHIIQTLSFGWGLAGWIIMRAGMIALWLLASGNPEYRTTALRYAGGIAFAQLCWVAMYFITQAHPGLFYILGIVVFAIELAVPAFAERARMTPFHRHHIIERYGLLTIISLGEIVLAISLAFAQLFDGEGHGNMLPALTGVSALVIVFAAFWVYFTDEDHLPSSKFSTVFMWGYGHVFLFGALAVMGAGVAAEVDLAAHTAHGATQASVAWWLGIPLAVYWLSLSLLRDRHFPLGPRQFALPLMAVLAIVASLLGSSTAVFAGLSVIAVLLRVPMRGEAMKAC
ncbi:low temperature requirement protein A [Pseudoxanthomonas dokdonensis]|uniref:Low temperature requirement protein A n=1 Tax=Pseudoxanthomonas dokdonensis TaxID=344882 RepID=A0A0R0D2F4_9GAMM|nr:low temperature requirement protein A [Pseudoxanthomonas dokdonensis]KRG71544.1 hypothetical protein ABB29_01870 [Pseudoxanthomonas dokdonensis]